MEPNIMSISSNLSNVRQDVFPLDQWTITTRKGIIMQSKCTCKSAESQNHQQQQQQQAANSGQNHARRQQTPSPQPPPPPSSPSSQQRNDKDYDKEPIELCDICRYHRFLPQLHSMPDMLFNNNLLRLEHISGVGIEFNPLDALKLVEETKDPLRVAVADGWQSARSDCPFAKNISRPFDWTFTTSYRGTILSAIKKSHAAAAAAAAANVNVTSTAKTTTAAAVAVAKTTEADKERSQSNSTNDTNPQQRSESTPTNTNSTGTLDQTSDVTSALSSSSSSPSSSSARPPMMTTTTTMRISSMGAAMETTMQTNEEDRLCLKVEETDERIDVNKLKVREEILFYDDVTLYEDELADHGTAQYSVKVRVMPSSLFILARYYLRIDGVLARINDTRIYQELNERYILREYTNREAKLSNMDLPVSTVINPNELMNYLPLIHSRYEKLTVPEVTK